MSKNMIDFPGIPGYKIIGELGKGGMARVFLGIQEKLNRQVAVKVLEPGLFQKESTIVRFENEARTAAGLNHSNIITILDTGKIGEYYYIVMEYLEESLRERMEYCPGCRIPPETALGIIKNIMTALDYAHIKGIYHRDIKPENIMFRQDNTPVLVDFGIARVLHSTDQLTRSQEILGSIHYVSPEQCRGEKDIDGRSDIYSLGVVLYEMLTGENPYDDDSPMSIILKHTQDPVPRLPRKFSRYQPLIDKMMAKNREDRISNSRQFDKLLEETLADPAYRTSKTVKFSSDTITAPVPAQLRKSKKLRYLVIFFVLLAAAGIFFYLKSPWFFSRDRGLILTLPTSTISVDTLFSPELQYHLDLNLAHGLSKTDNLLNLITAQEIIEGLDPVKLSPGLDGLKEKITNHLSDRYLTTARDYFEKKKYLDAKAMISLAKRIRTTPELEELEDRIDKSYGQHLRRLKQEQKDDGAFDMAVSGNTITDYYKYLVNFPRGHHIKAAKWKIKLLQDLAKKKLKGKKLRFGYKDPLKNKEAEAMVRRYNFFEANYNKGGYFRSYSEKIKKGNAYLIIDYTAGLVWYNGWGPGRMDFEKAEEWIVKLNKRKYGRFSDWRFPTLEEAASLLRKRKNKKGLHIDTLFTGNQKAIWTGDRSTVVMFKGRKHWVVFFDKGILEKSYKDNEHDVLAVRTLK
jgi:serine/threonine protein kinase